MWTQSHELAAMTVEKLEARLAGITAMWADEKSKGKVPPPIVLTHPERPEQPKPAKKTVGPGGIARLLGGR